MQQYEIWWANLPPPAGRKPVLLLSRNPAYLYLKRVLAVEVTSQVRGISLELPLGRSEGLKVRSVANFDNIRQIPVTWIESKIGTLAPSRNVEAKRALGHALGWDELIDVG